MSVQEYLDKHLLARKIEDAVNAAVRAKASDPVLFIVRPPGPSGYDSSLQLHLMLLLPNFLSLYLLQG